ncbi:PQ loop repeat-domain-containing protein [Kickxella alabastrina]|uniref:PQ loop repeat-domain-containing protein n=1 Tax=Kickxella alabastrina TaxID=61397 RepID=UPI00221F3C47|nr:PQ loop repeat-domain-containing protein [Kickxella alabastrina]KAI7825063.1 PQ loop repeat-domain-containing protein [Kickxella alabastrina]
MFIAPAVSLIAAETSREVLSNAIGYISLASWMVVMLPQIRLNYRRRSGEGVSLLMMMAWVFGDIFNIAGALLQGLVLSTILIGSYFLCVDLTMLSQTIYYRIVYKTHLVAKEQSREEEEQLLGAGAQGDNREYSGRQTDEAAGLGGSRQALADEIMPRGVWYSRIQLSDVLAVVLSRSIISNSEKSAAQTVAQAMGMLSAIVYIASYVPQVVQNYRRKSCEGLSMWLFLLSLLGNTTYALAIMVVSLDPQYLAPYVPWLLGSLIPCAIQVVILYQFQIYKH